MVVIGGNPKIVEKREGNHFVRAQQFGMNFIVSCVLLITF